MSNLIDLRNVDNKFKYELENLPAGEKIMSCFTCLSCVCSCPVNHVNGRLSPARIVHMAVLGMKEEIFASDFLWLCTSCYSCQEACPMGVKITDFINVLKNLAADAGYAPQVLKTQMEIIRAEGRIYPLDDFDNKKRNKMGLPSLPTSCDVVKDLIS